MQIASRAKHERTDDTGCVTRRTFLQGGALTMAALAAHAGQSTSQADPQPGRAERASGEPILRVGLLADAHYADVPDRNERHYRASLPKLRAAVEHFNRIGVDLTIQLGDFIDAADALWRDVDHLHVIESQFAALTAPRHYVLGNHCLDTLSKYEFVTGCGAKAYRALLPDGAVQPVRRAGLDPAIPRDTSIDGYYYSFDQKGYHFVVLDACYRPDGTPYCRGDFQWSVCHIPERQLAWLRKDLGKSSYPAIVCLHQRLDTERAQGVLNADDVRAVLEETGRVRVVLQGHDHSGDLTTINGIAYMTLSAMVTGPAEERGSYGVLEIFKDGAIRLAGHRGQASYELPAIGGIPAL